MTQPYNHKFSVQLRHTQWDKEKFPEGEDELGERLFSLVVEKSFQGKLPLELWLFTENAIQTVAFSTPVNHFQISSLCGMEGVLCAALLGPIVNAKKEPWGQVFLEWDDCRWWFGRQRLRNDGTIAFQIPKITKATASDGKPTSLGGWFSTARRLGLRAQLESQNGNWIH